MQKASSDDALRKQEALTYLRELKERLKNKKDTYDEFLEIMKEFKAQRCASGPNVLFFLLLIASNRREGWRSIRRDRRLPARATARTAPEPVIHITGGPLRVPFADLRHRSPRQTGSTPRVSSSESRRFSRDTKTSSSVSTSSCRRCVRQISRVSRRRAMRTARRGILRRSHAAYPRGVRVFASSRIAAVAPARAIPRACRLFSSRPSITRQQRPSRRTRRRAQSSKLGRFRAAGSVFFWMLERHRANCIINRNQ